MEGLHEDAKVQEAAGEATEAGGVPRLRSATFQLARSRWKEVDKPEPCQPLWCPGCSLHFFSLLLTYARHLAGRMHSPHRNPQEAPDVP